MHRPTDALASYEQARVIQERLTGEFSKSPQFASHLGVILNNMAEIDLDERRYAEATAKLKRAIECQRKALAVNPDHPTYRHYLTIHLTNLIQAADGLGRAEEAGQARRELAEFGKSDPRIMTFDARLASVLKGVAPKNEAERLQLAYRANEKRLYAASARLFEEALANNPKLIDDRQAQHRYNAARAASLAASGQGKDLPPLDDAAKAKLRKQAREWLEVELAAWAKVLGPGTPEMKANIVPTLQHWKADADLAGIRDEKELAKLSHEELAVLKQLWADVDQLLAKAGRNSASAGNESGHDY